MFHITMKELKMHDTRGFKEMMRMGPEQFDQILQAIDKSRIIKIKYSLITALSSRVWNGYSFLVRFLSLNKQLLSICEPCCQSVYL